MTRTALSPITFQRFLSWSKKPEYEVLAKALNLLSGSQPTYRPSLFQSAMTADKHLPVTPSEKHALTEALSVRMGRRHRDAETQLGASVTTHYSDLIRGLDLIHSYPLVDLSGKSDEQVCHLLKHSKTIQSEFQLIDIFNQVRDRGSYAVLHLLLTHPLTRNLTPFVGLLEGKPWTEVEKMQFEITVMKKHYQNRRPLTMFASRTALDRYLPAMIDGTLPLPYQRLLWKFYFLRTGATLEAAVASLLTQAIPTTPVQLTSHMFLMWESMPSAASSVACAARIQRMFTTDQLLLSDLQAVFVDFINEPLVQHNMKNRGLRIVDGRKEYSMSVFIKRFSITARMHDFTEFPYPVGSSTTFDVKDPAFARLLKFRSLSQDLLSKLQLTLVEGTQTNTEELQLVEAYRHRIETYLINKIRFEGQHDADTDATGSLTLMDRLKAEHRHTLVSLLM